MTKTFGASLSEQEKELLRSSLIRKKVKANDLIVGPNSKDIGVIKVLSGSLRVYVTSENGREITLAKLNSENPYYLSLSIYEDIDIFDINITAEKNSEIICISNVVYNSVISNNASARIQAYEYILSNFARIIKDHELRVFVKLEHRVIKLLLDQMRLQVSNVINITQEEIARETNSVRVVVTRTLNKIEDDGLISLKRGRIIIKDAEALKNNIEHLD